MKCLRCNTEMKKEKVLVHLGYSAEKSYPNGGGYQTPINAKSIYICPECGTIELNTKG